MKRAIATQTALRKSTDFYAKDNKIALALVCYRLFYSSVLQAIASTLPTREIQEPAAFNRLLGLSCYADGNLSCNSGSTSGTFAKTAS